MTNDVDLSFLKRRVAELEDNTLSLPETSKSAASGMDHWQTSVETRLTDIRTDLRYLRSGIGTLDGATATLKERIARLPTKGFIVAAFLASLAVIGALVIFESPIQSFLTRFH